MEGIVESAVREANADDVKLNDLTAASQRVGEAAQIIATIAQRTNLLALNATIKAARAGDAGRDFAAVASEEKARESRVVAVNISEVNDGARQTGAASTQLLSQAFWSNCAPPDAHAINVAKGQPNRFCR